MAINALEQYNRISDQLYGSIQLYRQAQEELTKKQNDPSYIVKEVKDHTVDFNNPHNVTKDQLGLDKVQNHPIASVDDIINANSKQRYMTPLRTQQQVEEALKSVELVNYLKKNLTVDQNSGNPKVVVDINEGTFFNVTISQNARVEFVQPTEGRFGEVILVIKKTDTSNLTFEVGQEDFVLSEEGTFVVKVLVGIADEAIIL